MKKIIIDLENKDEGILHSFVKQIIYYKLISYTGTWRYEFYGTNKGHKRFESIELATFWPTHTGSPLILNCYSPEELIKIVDSKDRIWMERKDFYDGKRRIPDIVILGEDKKPETVIEIIDSNSINYEKFTNYINQNVNIICVFVNTNLKSLNKFYNLNYLTIPKKYKLYQKCALAFKIFFQHKNYIGDIRQNFTEIMIRNHSKKGYMLYLKHSEKEKYSPYSGTLKKTKTSKDRNKHLEYLCQMYVSEVEKMPSEFSDEHERCRAKKSKKTGDLYWII